MAIRGVLVYPGAVGFATAYVMELTRAAGTQSRQVESLVYHTHTHANHDMGNEGRNAEHEKHVNSSIGYQ